jgi:hypothetical protein
MSAASVADMVHGNCISKAALTSLLGSAAINVDSNGTAQRELRSCSSTTGIHLLEV